MILTIISRTHRPFARWKWLIIARDEVVDKGTAFTQKRAKAAAQEARERLTKEINP